jgi:hypothetical protein
MARPDRQTRDSIDACVAGVGAVIKNISEIIFDLIAINLFSHCENYLRDIFGHAFHNG